MLFSTETLFEHLLNNLKDSFLDTILKRLEVSKMLDIGCWMMTAIVGVGGGGNRTFKLNTVDLSFV